MAKHEETPVPCYSSLDAVYGDGSQLEEAKLRFDHLKSKFLQVFGHPPDVFARSPGSKNPSLSLSSVLCLVPEKTKENQIFVFKKKKVDIDRVSLIIRARILLN